MKRDGSLYAQAQACLPCFLSLPCLSNVRPRAGVTVLPYHLGRFARLATSRRMHIRRRVAVLRNSLQAGLGSLGPHCVRRLPLRERSFGRQGRLGRQEGDLGSTAIFRLKPHAENGFCNDNMIQYAAWTVSRRTILLPPLPKTKFLGTDPEGVEAFEG